MTSSKTLLVSLLVCLSAGNAAAQPLRTRLTMRLDSLPLDRHVWGIAVLDRAGRLIYGRNANRMFMPASNTKLLVSATAVRLLPPGWTTTTSVFAGGPVVDGTLRGDLLLYGQGDPTWSRRCYAVEPAPDSACQADALEPVRQLARAVLNAGIKRVAGRLIGDGSYFEPTLTHPSWEQDDLVWGYGAPVSGLAFNENMVVATVSPGPRPGTPPVVSLEPDIGGLAVENRAITVADADPAVAVTWRRGADGRTAVLTGSVRQNDRPDRSELAVADPNRFAALALAKVLADAGVIIHGGVASTVDSTSFRALRQQTPLGSVHSRPFEDWVFAILNVSQNWFAETLLKHLGKRFGSAGSWSEGLRIERRFLIDSLGIDSTQFLAHDGSGLSAKNLASPLTLVSVLRSMRRDPRYVRFGAGLPRSAATGSLQRRFVNTPVEGLIRAKTGSIGQVNTLSGYLEPDSLLRARTRPCSVFSVQANHHGLGGRTMVQAIDSIVVELSRDSPCRRR